MNSIFDKFKLKSEKEDLQIVVENIHNGVVFRGTNLWILIFAIFVASLGLNVNSTAVVIGAMLISPLMGPIMGIGLGIGIGDVPLLRKAFQNLLIATCVALATSTLFFVLSPLNDAHSEILARTAPTIYDVLIALFGGCAGILATSSKQKGNVIPGVAIATALMPPLCTAGYGLATFQLGYFVGAFYLFVINAVFIALATFLIVRVLHFPHRKMQNSKSERRAQMLVWMVVLLTLLPSIYFGFDMVRQNRFTKNANQFIANEAHFTNDYLLNKKIDAKAHRITLVFGGKEILPAEMESLKKQLKRYGLEDAILEIKQGFSSLSNIDNKFEGDASIDLKMALEGRENQLKSLQKKLDSINYGRLFNTQLYEELKAQYPSLKNAVIQPSHLMSDSGKTRPVVVILLTLPETINQAGKKKLENWLIARLKNPNIHLIIEK